MAEPTGARNPASRPRRQPLLAEADHHQRLIAHLLDHIDLAIEVEHPGCAEHDVLRPYADLADGLAGAGGAAAQAKRRRHAGDMQAGIVDRGAQQIIGGLPTKSATKRLAGRS